MSSENFSKYLAMARTMSDLSNTAAALQWDQETYMPNKAAGVRAEQIATLSTIIHRMNVSPEYSDLIDSLNRETHNGGLADWEKASIRESHRAWERASKLPSDLVGEVARSQSLAQQAWKHARQESDFSLFADALRHLVELKRAEAEHVGYEENLYDALIDQYEQGMTVSQLRPVFDRLKTGTLALMARVAASKQPVDDRLLYLDYDPDKQLEFSRRIVDKLGFDFEAGRLDLSAHPFCTSFGITDVRLTTRIHRDDLRSCLFGLIHEAGHGMYEQGINPKFERTPLADGISMGIHESQSLFWENVIARSEPFWEWAYPQLQSVFPQQLGSVPMLDFYRSVNVMQPSLIRVEADELTYNLHIILRFEIEEELMNGRLQVDDIPAVWNARTQEYLGITPPDDASGCLQDVHWSFGGFGYFPCYSLGKLYSAMINTRVTEEIPGLADQIRKGEFGELLAWLREHVHQWGKAKSASQLIFDVCGRSLTEEDFLQRLDRKIERVYGT